MNPIMEFMVWIMFFFIFGHTFVESVMYAIGAHLLTAIVKRIWR